MQLLDKKLIEESDPEAVQIAKAIWHYYDWSEACTALGVHAAAESYGQEWATKEAPYYQGAAHRAILGYLRNPEAARKKEIGT
jgi:hypothetical protein